MPARLRSSSRRRVAALLVSAAFSAGACGGRPSPAPRVGRTDPPPEDAALALGGLDALGASASSSSSSAEGEGCLVVHEDVSGQSAAVEGVVIEAKTAGGKAAPAPLLIRLAHARCVVGLPHTRVAKEVWIASTGADLRPFVGARVRMTGDVIGGMTDNGEAAVVLLVRDVERLAASSTDSL
jgi:hypothetical protein